MTRDAYEAMAGCARRRIAGEWVCTEAERAVLGLVNELSYELGQSFALVPGLGDFAAVLGIHKSTVSRAIRSALKKGFLIILKRRDETLYGVCLETPAMVVEKDAAVDGEAVRKRLLDLNAMRLQGAADGDGQIRLPGILPSEEAEAPVRAFAVMMEAISSTQERGPAQADGVKRSDFSEEGDFSSSPGRGMPVERPNHVCDMAGEALTGLTGGTSQTGAGEESIEEKLHRVGEEMRRRWEAEGPGHAMQPKGPVLQPEGALMQPERGNMQNGQTFLHAEGSATASARPAARKGKHPPATWDEMSRGLRGDALHALEVLREECCLAGPKEEAALYQWGLTWRKRCTTWPRAMAEAAGICKAMRLEGNRVRSPGGFVWHELQRLTAALPAGP